MLGAIVEDQIERLMPAPVQTALQIRDAAEAIGPSSRETHDRIFMIAGDASDRRHSERILLDEVRAPLEHSSLEKVANVAEAWAQEAEAERRVYEAWRQQQSAANTQVPLDIFGAVSGAALQPEPEPPTPNPCAGPLPTVRWNGGGRLGSGGPCLAGRAAEHSVLRKQARFIIEMVVRQQAELHAAGAVVTQVFTDQGAPLAPGCRLPKIAEDAGHSDEVIGRARSTRICRSPRGRAVRPDAYGRRMETLAP